MRTFTFYEGNGNSHEISLAMQAFDLIDAQKARGEFAGELSMFLSHTSYLGPLGEATAEAATMESFRFQLTQDGALFISDNGVVVGGYIREYLVGSMSMPARGFAFIGG